MAQIHKFGLANSLLDSSMATWLTLTGTLYIKKNDAIHTNIYAHTNAYSEWLRTDRLRTQKKLKNRCILRTETYSESKQTQNWNILNKHKLRTDTGSDQKDSEFRTETDSEQTDSEPI